MGVTLHTGDMDMADLLRYAREAEALGYEGFWPTEESGKEAFAVLALVAQTTERLTLGTAIVNFYARTPTLLAVGASTIWRLSGGRMALGIGPGGIGFTERGHGVHIVRPLARAKETIEIVRGLLTKSRFSYDGAWFQLRDFRLREGPLDGKLPIHLSALNPKMVALAARIADGFISNWPTDASLAELRGIVAREAAAVGRDPAEVTILTLLMTCPDPNDDEAVQAMRRGLAFYCASPHYHHIADVSGFGAEARRVYDVWQTGDFVGAARLVTDAMVESLSLTDSFDACRARLQRMVGDGVYPLIYPIPRRGRVVEDHLAAIRLAARYLEA